MALEKSGNVFLLRFVHLSGVIDVVCVDHASVHRLALLSQSLGVRMPHYEHQWSNDGRCQARVVVNNMTFAGSLARTYDQAAESAASLALFNLVEIFHRILAQEIDNGSETVVLLCSGGHV